MSSNRKERIYERNGLNVLGDLIPKLMVPIQYRRDIIRLSERRGTSVEEEIERAIFNHLMKHGK